MKLTKVRYGESSEAVKNIQTALFKLGYKLKVDGKFGNGTSTIIRKFQSDNSLKSDGLVGTRTLAKLETLLTSPKGHGKYKITKQDLIEASDLLEVELPALQSVMEVESSGNGFFSNGHPSILFERRWMYRQLENKGISPVVYMDIVPNIVNGKSGGYKGYEKEIIRLNIAESINKQCARESTSWGAFQIMGFHWRNLGFNSVDEFVELMSKDDISQLNIFVKFIEVNPAMHQALRFLDFEKFARYYNGPKYYLPKPGYHVKLQSSYDKFKLES